MLQFNYENLRDEINRMKKCYPFLNVTCEGRSIKGKMIFAISFGRGANEVLINGAHHGMEWITSPLVLRFLRDCCEGYVSGRRFKCYDMRSIYDKVTLFVMPMVNPDGVNIAVNEGVRWQANARGVDLNHNYNAMWNRAQEMERQAGITGPCATRYGGAAPESEPETRAVTDFVRQHNIQRLIALHTQGEEIFYSFGGLEPPESLPLAMQMARVSGYKISHPEDIASCGGCKDWFISEFRRPGFTIEAGRGRNPLPPGQFDDIYEKLAEILLVALNFD